jgi:hypothetical protein
MVLVDCVHAANEDNMMNRFADQDEEDNRDVSLPTRHEVVSDPNQAPPLDDLNRDGDTCGANEVHHSDVQGLQGAVRVDILNKLQESGVLLVKLISKLGEYDCNKDLHDGGVRHFWDHQMVLVVAEHVAGASSGDPLEYHLHVRDHHEI